jgi:hypothetical protein
MAIVSGAAAWLLFAVSMTGTDARYSRAAFALALKASLLAIGLGVAGLERSKRPGRKGRGLAVAGLMLGMLPYVLPVLLIIWLIMNGTNPISG